MFKAAVFEMDPSSHFEKLKEKALEKGLLRWWINVAIVLAAMLLISVVFNMRQALSEPKSKLCFPYDMERPDERSCHEFLIQYQTDSPKTGTLECPNCPPWLEKFLQIAHLVRFRNLPKDSGRGNQGYKVGCKGKVDIHADIGVINIAFSEEIFDFEIPHSIPFKYQAFVNGTAQAAKAEEFWANGEESEEVANDWMDFLSSLFLNFREIMSLESISVVGGRRTGMADWGEMTFNLNKAGSFANIKDNFNQLNGHNDEWCKCARFTPIEVDETGKPTKLQLKRGCHDNGDIISKFLPILDLLCPIPAFLSI